MFYRDDRPWVRPFVAMRKLTEWKNAGKGPRPMKLSNPQEIAFRRFLSKLRSYLKPDGSRQLRQDFFNQAPIWSIFWHHVLYSTPIFDVYTHMAYHWDITEVILTKRGARIYAPGHWLTYDRYCVWLKQTLFRIRSVDPTISERDLDRALWCWGEAQHKTANDSEGDSRPVERTE